MWDSASITLGCAKRSLFDFVLVYAEQAARGHSGPAHCRADSAEEGRCGALHSFPLQIRHHAVRFGRLGPKASPPIHLPNNFTAFSHSGLDSINDNA